MRICWNRQTGKFEVLVLIRACEFKSRYPHQIQSTAVSVQAGNIGTPTAPIEERAYYGLGKMLNNKEPEANALLPVRHRAENISADISWCRISRLQTRG